MKSTRTRLLLFSLQPSSFILSIPFLLDLPQQPVDALAFLFDAIPHKVNLGCTRKVEGEAQLFANVGRGVTQSAERQPVFLFISRNRDKNLRVPAIVRKANVGHRYHCQSRVFEFVPDNLGNLLTNNICNSLWATHKDTKQ